MLRGITIVLARLYAVVLFTNSFQTLVLLVANTSSMIKEVGSATYVTTMVSYQALMVVVSISIWFGAPRLVRYLHPGPVPEDEKLPDAESIITAGTFLIGLFIFAANLGQAIQFLGSMGGPPRAEIDQIIVFLVSPILGIILMSFSGVLGDVLRRIHERIRKLGLEEDEA